MTSFEDFKLLARPRGRSIESICLKLKDKLGEDAELDYTLGGSPLDVVRGTLSGEFGSVEVYPDDMTVGGFFYFNAVAVAARFKDTQKSEELEQIRKYTIVREILGPRVQVYKRF